MYFLIFVVVITSMLLGLSVSQAKSQEIYELTVCPWTPENPRNDHQLIFPMKDGRLLLVWSEYYVKRPSRITRTPYSKAGSGDETPCRITGKISSDRGRTWSSRIILQENIGGKNVKHPNLLRLPSGELLFFFTVWNSNTDRRICMKRSHDECETWSELEQVSTLPGFHCINNDHVIQLSSGRILVPTHQSDFYGKDDHFQAFCYYSDDDGDMWHESDRNMDLPKRGAEEPSIVELKDGALLAVMRTSLGRVYKSYSSDGGNHWTEPEPTELAAPASPPLMKRIPKTGDLLIIWNNNYEPSHHHQGSRNPLTAAISKDEGKTWENFKDIENHVGYDSAYAAVTFVDEEVLVTYYNRSESMARDSWVKLKIFTVDWFYQ